MESKVIIGEAPETDSEEELQTSNNVTPARISKSIQGEIIAGEASESEDEHGSSVSSAVSALTHPNVKSSNVKSNDHSNDEKFKSLLHKKLKERNRSLHNNLQMFTHNVINEAAKNLTSTNQRLLKSQVTLQAAVTSLRSLNHNAQTLKGKLDFTVSSTFLPNVRADINNGQ